MGGFCVNGHPRGRSRTEYDWLRGDLRIECKSAQLRWDRHSKRWRLQFYNIKMKSHIRFSEALFDELLLALYTPRGVYIYRHDLIVGVTSNGRSTESEGSGIIITHMGQDWFSALDGMLLKLDNSECERVALVAW